MSSYGIDGELSSARKEVIKLRSQLENLKCCGNCAYYFKCFDTDPKMLCTVENDAWEWDGLTKQQRKERFAEMMRNTIKALNTQIKEK